MTTPRVTVPVDTFNGDNAALVASISALLEAPDASLSARVPGMAKQLLASAAARLSAAPAPEGGAVDYGVRTEGAPGITEPDPALASREEPPAEAGADDVQRTASGETVLGFKVAAWQYLGPNDDSDAKYGHRYCEHWSTVGSHPKKVVRLFTEDQLRAALRAQPPAREDAQPVAKPAPFNPGGIGHAMYQAFNAYLADYVLSTDGDDYVPTPFERDLIEDFFAGLMAEEAFFGPVRALYDTHPAPGALRVAVKDIAAERQRQVDVEGWSAERDDEYTDRSLAHAAAAYALGFDLETRAEVITDDVSGGRGDTPVWRYREIRVPASWPTSWAAEWWKPSDARRDLVKAGALIVAEIERLDRAALQAEQGEK